MLKFNIQLFTLKCLTESIKNINDIINILIPSGMTKSEFFENIIAIKRPIKGQLLKFKKKIKILAHNFHIRNCHFS